MTHEMTIEQYAAALTQAEIVNARLAKQVTKLDTALVEAETFIMQSQIRHEFIEEADLWRAYQATWKAARSQVAAGDDFGASHLFYAAAKLLLDIDIEEWGGLALALYVREVAQRYIDGHFWAEALAFLNDDIGLSHGWYVHERLVQMQKACEVHVLASA